MRATRSIWTPIGRLTRVVDGQQGSQPEIQLTLRGHDESFAKALNLSFKASYTPRSVMASPEATRRPQGMACAIGSGRSSRASIHRA